MSIARSRFHAASLCVAALVSTLVFGMCCALHAQPAYADLATTELAVQADASGTAAAPTQLTTSMFTFIDTKPSENYSGLTVTLANGNTALTSGTNYSYTYPSSAANSEGGKTFSVAGVDTYAGTISVNYKASVEGEPAAGAEALQAKYVQMRYNSTDGFKVSLGSVGKQLYGSNVDASASSKNLTGTLTLNGKGTYAGQSIQVTYSIECKSEIRESMVAVGVSGSSIQVAVKNGSKTLKKGTDYTLADFTPEGADANGEPLHVCVEGTGSWTGTVDYYCVIDDGIIVKKSYLPDCTIELSEKTFLYDGSPHKPASVTVKDGSTVLKEGTDYEVSNPSNTGALGTYTVTVTGKGDYRGKKELEYSIVKKAENLKIVLPDNHKSFTYTGSSRQPSWGTTTSYSRVVLLEEDGTEQKTLTNNTDYEVEIWPSTTINAGTYTITVTGKGDYADAGSVQATYTIEPAQLKVSYSYFSGYNSYPSTYYYTGKQIKPTLSSLTVSGVSGSLVLDTDYTVQYINNTNVADKDSESAPTIKLIGKGNFTGDDSVTFTIGACPLTSTYVEYEYSSTITYTGKSIKAQPKSVKIKSTGVALTKGKDYVVDEDKYANNTNAGTATGGIEGIGSKFSGSMTTNFTINPKSITASNITVSSVKAQKYTGSALLPSVTVKDKGAGVTLKAGAVQTYYTYDATTGGMKPYQSLPSGYDYYLEGKNNTNPGTATLKIVGGNNYKGTRTVKFKIKGTGTIPKLTAKKSNVKNGTATISLSWNPIYKSTKYRVLEKTLTGKYSTIINNYKSTSYSFTGVSTNQTHKYLVQAYVNKKWTSKADKHLATVSFKTKKSVTIPKVKATKSNVKKGTATVQLKWKPVYNAVKYRILEKAQNGAYLTYTNNYTNTSYKVTGVNTSYTHKYLVQAYVNKKWTSKADKHLAVVSFKPKNASSIPKVKAKNKGGGAVLLTWGSIYGADKYMVLEKNQDGSYRTLSASLQSTSCTISNLSVTRSHRFLVRAHVNGKWSSKSDKYLVSIKPTGAKKPSIRAQSYSDTEILLFWDQVPGASKYALYEKVGKTFQARTDSYTATTVRFTGLTKKKSYTYRVKAYVDGKWSKNSNTVTCSPADPVSPAVKAVGGVGKGKVKLTWTAGRNATKYKVQVKASGKWKTLSSNVKKRTYTVSGLSSSKKHTFRVLSYGHGKWSQAYSPFYASATPDNA